MTAFRLAPAPDGIQAGRSHSWDELSQVLLPVARSRLTADNTELGGKSGQSMRSGKAIIQPAQARPGW